MFCRLHTCLLFIALCFAPLCAAAQDNEEKLQRGDIVFIALRTHAGWYICKTTGSPVSHVGIIDRNAAGELTVIHAGITVEEIKLDAFMKYGNGRLAAVRFPFADASQRETFILTARSFIGVAYDMKYRIDNEEIYCSELIYRSFLDGLALTPTPLKAMDYKAAGEKVWQFWVRFFKGDVPHGELGIGPGAILADPDFHTVINEFVQDNATP